MSFVSLLIRVAELPFPWERRHPCLHGLAREEQAGMPALPGLSGLKLLTLGRADG